MVYSRGQSGQSPFSAPSKDDRLTLIGISALACILQDVLHEGLGDGVTAWLSGAHRVTMSTVALQSDIDTRWISANGTLVNLAAAAILWLALLRPARYRPAIRYFLVLAMAGNLFTGTGYFMFSGVSNFGDWAEVIRGSKPHWMWEAGLVLLGATSYYASMLVVAGELRPFRGESRRRVRVLCWTPYFTDGILAGVGGWFNRDPSGRAFLPRTFSLRHAKLRPRRQWRDRDRRASPAAPLGAIPAVPA